jgi:hypothetical protein
LKGIVVDIEGKYAVVLNKQGEFIRIRNNGKLCIGCEAEVSPVTVFRHSAARVASIAAASLF